jgi:enoyl-CoA hydratase
MDLILTGRTFTAAEAAEWGLISRVAPAESVLDEALEVAAVIASYSVPVVRSARRLIEQAFEAQLSDGIASERADFYQTFDLEDAKEGVAAFIEKRPPTFNSARSFQPAPKV